MSFLERLKREADQQRLQAEQAAREREALETRYRTQIEPRMKALTQYLEGLAATLLEVRPAFVVQMPIQGYGDLCTVPFYDYKVEHERRHRSFVVTMTWSLRVDPERTPAVRADNVTRVRTLTNLFRQYHLGGIKEEKRTAQGELSAATFHARGYIKARLQAQISAEDPVLRMVLDNASWLGSSRKQVPWERIDDALFDRIARFVVREDDSLFSEELPEELKQKLRRDQTGTAPKPAPVAASLAEGPVQAATEPPPEALQPLVQALVAPDPEPAEAAAPTLDHTSFVPSVIPAPAPVSAIDVIEFDESKLGLDRFDLSEDAGDGFAFGAPRSLPPVPAPAPATPPPAAAPAATGVPASAPTASVAPPAPAPAQRVTAPSPVPQPPAAAPPAATPAARAPSPAPQPPAEAQPAAAADSPDSEREAALFRLKVRAMLARMRSSEDSGKG